MPTTANGSAFPPNPLHPGQRPPPGVWRTWLCIGGQGAGKTHAMSAAVIAEAMGDPEARILVVGASLADALRVQVGVDDRAPRPSSILALTPSDFVPVVRQARRVLEFPNGSRVFWASARNPDHLRGFFYSLVCARSLSEWRSFQALQECRYAARHQTERMRQEARPARLLLSSRAEHTALLRNAVNESHDLVRTRLSTYDNESHLEPSFMEIAHRLRHTAQGRREFGGELSFSVDEADACASNPNA